MRRSAQRDPDKLAVSCGDVTWTFAEIDAVCNRLGRGLLGLGVAKGDRVAVLSRNSHAFAALRFALARLGAVLVPINFMLKADEIELHPAPAPARSCWRPARTSSSRRAPRRRRDTRSRS